MTEPVKLRKRIHSLERLRLSKYGNPRFAVQFTDGTAAQTQADAACNYGLENREYRENDVWVTFSKAGRIVYVDPIVEE